jgi:hypothetical protein
VRHSANGVLQTSLRCAYAYRDVGGVRLYVRTYEGSSPGPTTLGIYPVAGFKDFRPALLGLRLAAR